MRVLIFTYLTVLSLQFKKDKRGGFSLGISVRGLIVYEVSVLRSLCQFHSFCTLTDVADLFSNAMAEVMVF